MSYNNNNLGQWRDNSNLRTTLNRLRPKTNWVVYRNGRPVSGLCHRTISDCRQEFMHWARIVTQFPDNSKLGVMASDGTYVPLASTKALARHLAD